MRISKLARRLGLLLAICTLASFGIGSNLATAEPSLTPVQGAGTFTGLIQTPPGAVSTACTAPTGPYVFSGIQISGATQDPASGAKYVGTVAVTGVTGITQTTDDAELFDAVPVLGCPQGTASFFQGDGSVNDSSNPFTCSAGIHVVGNSYSCRLWGDFTRLGNVVLVDLTGCVHVDATCSATEADNVGVTLAASLTPDPTGISVAGTTVNVNLYDITGAFEFGGPASPPGP